MEFSPLTGAKVGSGLIGGPVRGVSVTTSQARLMTLRTMVCNPENSLTLKISCVSEAICLSWAWFTRFVIPTAMTVASGSAKNR